MTRREAREQAFIIIFEKIFNDDMTVSEIIEFGKEAEIIKVNTFSQSLIDAVTNNSTAIDEIISAYCRDWSIERISKVSLAVLRLAIGEIKYIEEVPAGVAVNEAVEISKKYGSKEDATFVNGILGSVCKE